MRVCVINETFAQQFFGGRNPLGKRVAVGGDEQRRTLQVVGVAKDVRVYSLRARIDAKFYEAADQNGGVPFFEIRTTDNAENILTQVRRLVQTFDPDLTIQSAQSVDGLVDAQNAEPRLIAQLCTSFALLAVLLAGIGIYGVLSQSVARRTNEIGIRLALGANQNRVSGMILRETALLITSGMVLGLAVAAALARLLATQLSGPSATAPRWTMEQYEHVDSAVRLFGLDATDPLTLLAAAGFLGVLGMAAAYVPAMRAARVDPVNALRHG
jgi:ABC-type antimicrobial peptide transport system permease subunit